MSESGEAAPEIPPADDEPAEPAEDAGEPEQTAAQDDEVPPPPDPEAEEAVEPGEAEPPAEPDASAAEPEHEEAPVAPEPEPEEAPAAEDQEPEDAPAAAPEPEPEEAPAESEQAAAEQDESASVAEPEQPTAEEPADGGAATDEPQPAEQEQEEQPEPAAAPFVFGGSGGSEAGEGGAQEEEEQAPPAPKPAAAAPAAPPSHHDDDGGSSHKASSSTKGSHKGTLDSLGTAVHPLSPSKIKSTGPWLSGTYKTPKGRVLTGEELCTSLERMTNAYVDKYANEAEMGPLHIGTGVTMSHKTMSPDEIEGMVSRLYTAKAGDDNEFKMERVNLKFDEEGKEQWVPVKQVAADEQKAYMVELYDRCLEKKKKTEEELAAKYLKPLGQPRKLP